MKAFDAESFLAKAATISADHAVQSEETLFSDDEVDALTLDEKRTALSSAVNQWRKYAIHTFQNQTGIMVLQNLKNTFRTFRTYFPRSFGEGGEG